MKKNIVLFIVSVILFTGCAFTKPDIPKYDKTKLDKIGYLVRIENPNVEHFHLGTTVFNNFKKTYNFNWKYKPQIEKRLKEQLNTQLVDLSKYSYSYDTLNELIKAEDDKWIINKKDVYNKLNELGIKAIVLIKDKPGFIYLHPFSFHPKGSGLVSHHFIGIKRYFNVLSVVSDIYLLNPKAKINAVRDTYYNIIYDPMMSSYEEKSGFKVPKDVENITEEELAPVKKMNYLMIDLLVEETIKNLR